MPFSYDMFFPPADCEAEQKLIPNSKFRVVDSLWAHFAMFCLTRRIESRSTAAFVIC